MGGRPGEWWQKRLAGRGWWLLGAGLALLAVALAVLGDPVRPAPAEPPAPASPGPAAWQPFDTQTAPVAFAVPAGFSATVQDGKALAESEAVFFPSPADPRAGFSYTLCRAPDPPRCVPRQARLIASAKVTVDGTSRSLQVVSERADSAGGRMLHWQTLTPVGPQLYVSMGMQYPAGYDGAAALEDLYREWLARVRFPAGS